MSRILIRTLALAAFVVSSTAGAWNGPVNTTCSGTTTAGTVFTGTQGWSVDPATGNGYWSCCMAGTSCVGRDKPARFITHAEPLEPGSATSAPVRSVRPRGERMPIQPERQSEAPRERGH